MSKAVNSKWKKTFPDTIGNQNRPANGVDDTQPFETGGFPQYMANDPVRYDLQNAAMSQSMSNDARLKEMVDARGKELDDHKVDSGAHKTGIAGNAATATKVVATAAAGASANIAEATMASSDYARIRVSGNDNAGELALETADNGSEPIVARQYTGAYTNAVRTAKILDESGNTSFPGTVVAPKFTGALSGNAATATKLSTERKINITGNASGSAAFNGTSDVSINVSVSQAAHADKATNAGSANKLFYSEHGGNSIQNGANDFSPTVGGDSANMNITSWYGVSFTNGCNSGVIPQGKTAVGIDVRNSVVRAKTFEGALNGNATSATKLATTRAISLTGNASGSANFDGSGNVSISTTVNESKHAVNADNATNASHASSADSATNADKVDGVHAASLFYNKGNWDADNWATMGAYQTNGTPPSSDWYGWGQVISSSTGNTRFQLYASDIYASDGRLHYRTGWGDRKNQWNTILDSENYNSFAPTKTGGGASGTWGINISGNAASATNADKLDGYHASDIISKIQDITPKTAAAIGQFRELVVNDSHQIKLPDGGTWAYFVYTYNSWSGDDSNNEHRTRTGAGIAAGGTVLHTDGNITSNTINAFKLSGTTGAGGADDNNIIVGGFCWRIA